jgi:serine/threonine-protein kinase RsbW
MTTDNGPNNVRMVVESSFSVLEKVVDEAHDFCVNCSASEDVLHRVMLLTSEAVTNAIKHGNKLAEDKSVEIEFIHKNGAIEIWIQDEGDGFQRDNIPDPLADEQLLAVGGRGIFLIEEIADDVRYEQDGRKVGMFFRMTPESS